MQRRWCPLAGGLIFVVAVAAVMHGAEPTPVSAPTSLTFSVVETYNQKPFEYRMTLLDQRDGFRVYRMTYPSPVATAVEQNNAVRADFYLPDNITPESAKRPAVIVLHILNGDMRVTDVACSVLARRGILAIMPTLPYYGERAKAEGWDALLREPPLFLGMLLQSIEDIRRTADLLASRPEVDPERIDLSGVSLGGIVAASAAASDPRFFRTSLFLAGGDLLTILQHARYTRRLNKRFEELPADERAALLAEVAKVEPLTLAPALRSRAEQGRVLMINAAADEIIPRACTEKLAAALGIADRVVWIDGVEHDRFITALPQSLRIITEFFSQDLPADVIPSRPAATQATTPLGRASAFLHQARIMFTAEPSPGRCHWLEMDISVGPKGQKPLDARVRLVRGADYKFTLKCRLPVVGEVIAGQNEHPWMVAAGNRVLKGMKEPGENRNPLCFVNPAYRANLQIVAGLIGCLDLVPETLDQWVTVEASAAIDAHPAIRILAKEKYPGHVLISFEEDGQTPSQIEFDAGDVAGKVVLRDWKLDAAVADTAFDAPSGLEVVEMKQADLYRTFAAIISLLMQQASSKTGTLHAGLDGIACRGQASQF